VYHSDYEGVCAHVKVCVAVDVNIMTSLP